MSRKCAVTGKGPLSGHNVSHANNKTKRQFLPNLQNVSLLSQSLGRSFNFRLTTRGIRTVEKHGGLDGYVAGTPNRKLAPEFIKIKKEVMAKAKISA